MSYYRVTTLTLVAFALSAFANLGAHAASTNKAGPVARYHVEGKFEYVSEDIKLAIQNRGLVVDHTSHINDMLVRTGKDLGTTKQVFVEADAYSFCSASVSRKMMEADPHNIAYCPYVIAVYVLPQEPKRVYVTFRRPEPPTGNANSRKALREVEELLDGIVREALNLK